MIFYKNKLNKFKEIKESQNYKTSINGYELFNKHIHCFQMSTFQSQLVSSRSFHIRQIAPALESYKSFHTPGASVLEITLLPKFILSIHLVRLLVSCTNMILLNLELIHKNS